MDEAVVCTNCGCAIKKEELARATGDDKVNAGLVVASVLLPIIGVILWPVKHKETPKAAMTYGLTGIISWVVWAAILMV